MEGEVLLYIFSALRSCTAWVGASPVIKRSQVGGPYSLVDSVHIVGAALSGGENNMHILENGGAGTL